MCAQYAHRLGYDVIQMVVVLEGNADCVRYAIGDHWKQLVTLRALGYVLGCISPVMYDFTHVIVGLWMQTSFGRCELRECERLDVVEER